MKRIALLGIVLALAACADTSATTRQVLPGVTCSSVPNNRPYGPNPSRSAGSPPKAAMLVWTQRSAAC